MYAMNLQTWRTRRPTKLAAGMNFTARRGKAHNLTDDANTLCVRGTLDNSPGVLAWMHRTHTVCRCCGSKTGAFVLTDRGRTRLARLRRKRILDRIQRSGAHWTG